LVPEARLQSANYGLLAQATLSPTLPADFPRWEGYDIFSFLTASNHFLFFPEEKTFMGFAATSPTEDLLAILGTHTGLQWWLDLQAKPRPWTTVDGVSCQVESGFSDVYEGITMTNTGIPLRDYVARQGKQRKPLRLIGHSLGAAVAGLVAGDAYLPRLRNFAMPKFSDLVLSKHVAAKTTPDSVVSRNVQDVVPMAPPFDLYGSVLPEAWFNSDVFGIAGSDAARHNMQDCYLAASLKEAELLNGTE
jgi:hypothetical protein